MNRENFEKWMRDLETTDEPQTKNALADKDGFCCLGRLCEVAIADGAPIRRARARYSPEFIAYNSQSGYPPVEAAEWLGIDDGESATEEIALFCYGVAMNDSGASFKEIAAALRKEAG